MAPSKLICCIEEARKGSVADGPFGNEDVLPGSVVGGVPARLLKMKFGAAGGPR